MFTWLGAKLTEISRLRSGLHAEEQGIDGGTALGGVQCQGKRGTGGIRRFR